jgi:bacterioferritin-associated ferredoxin
MWICVCSGVTGEQLDALIERGVCQPSDIADACGAGADCGACRSRIERWVTNGSRRTGHLALQG